MSVIGPRPLLVEYLPYYTKEEHHRHDVRPGLSGWAQINGTDNIQTVNEHLSYVFFCSKRLSTPTCSKSMKNCTTGIKVLFCAGRSRWGSRWGRSLMDFLVSLVGRTLLNLKTFLDGTEMMEDSLYEGQIHYTKIRKVHQLEDWMEKWQLKHRMKWDWS